MSRVFTKLFLRDGQLAALLCIVAGALVGIFAYAVSSSLLTAWGFGGLAYLFLIYLVWLGRGKMRWPHEH